MMRAQNSRSGAAVAFGDRSSFLLLLNISRCQIIADDLAGASANRCWRS